MVSGDKTIHKNAPHVHIGQNKIYFNNIEELQEGLKSIDTKLAKDHQILEAGKALLETAGITP